MLESISQKICGDQPNKRTAFTKGCVKENRIKLGTKRQKLHFYVSFYVSFNKYKFYVAIISWCFNLHFVPYLEAKVLLFANLQNIEIVYEIGIY